MSLDNEATSNVRKVAVLVRSIVEVVSASIWHPIGVFPNGWCDDCSRVLGILLREQGESGFMRVVGRRGEHSEKTHVWLRRGSLIVDITADQFQDEISSPVMVTTDHSWHARWEQSGDELEEIDDSRTEGKLYRAITNHTEWRLWQTTASKLTD
jgi:hypothetical protein